ncbi:MAG: ubiquinone/menaquinone biosynthesis methyltransferase [Candidatus Methylacidiphilales bacterium]|nr:ubiquinone/menaquinone biosynthesis methyltransferase [Candidatus Methylacidiphilales bacterium]
MFARISAPYDRLNHLFSGGVDYWWRFLLVRSLPKSEFNHQKSEILDLACGTGDVTLALQQAGFDAVGGDFCEPMLERARAKGVKKTVVADALALPFPDASFYAVTLAFGYRNFEDRERALREIHRVLKPGGTVHILEFSQPFRWFRPFYYFYLRHLLPRAAKILCRDRAAYEYLSSSISAFPDVEEIGRELERAGFGEVHWSRPTLGIVALHRASRS